MLEIDKIIKSLSMKNPIFHYERDFQACFASEVQIYFPESEIECEYVTDRNGRKEFTDILVRQGNTTCVFELKYKKKRS
jgi:hypothetical protein